MSLVRVNHLVGTNHGPTTDIPNKHEQGQNGVWFGKGSSNVKQIHN